MKLYMKQKVFSFADRFYIKDEEGRDRYYVEGELSPGGKSFMSMMRAVRKLPLSSRKYGVFCQDFMCT